MDSVSVFCIAFALLCVVLLASSFAVDVVAAVVDRFYMALLSAPEQTHCAGM